MDSHARVQRAKTLAICGRDLLPPYSIHEVERFEQDESCEMPDGLKEWLTTVSREICVDKPLTFGLTKKFSLSGSCALPSRAGAPELPVHKYAPFFCVDHGEAADDEDPDMQTCYCGKPFVCALDGFMELGRDGDGDYYHISVRGDWYGHVFLEDRDFVTALYTNFESFMCFICSDLDCGDASLVALHSL